MANDASSSLSHAIDSTRRTAREGARAALADDGTGRNIDRDLRSVDVTIRLLAGETEFRAAVGLEMDTWGGDSTDIVPSSLMQVAARVGGVAAGAFAEGDELVGFVFSLPGILGGEAVNWSHMLAVRPELRGGGIGRRLKEFQLAELARRGIARLYWTFDPLQARNAHLNLNRLGARVEEYVVDMYGTTTSPLHHGMPTDRLIVSCNTAARTLPDKSTVSPGQAYPLLSPFPRAGDATVDTTRPHLYEVALIEIPVDLEQIASSSPSLAVQWRLATRAHFQWAMHHGFVVTALHRDRAAERAFYLLTRPSIFLTSSHSP